MKPIAVTNFSGIAPILQGHAKPGVAMTAQNCDLSSRKLRPLPDFLLVEPVTGGPYDSIIKYEGRWYYGNKQFYLNWNLLGLNALLWLNNGVAQKMIGGVTANLGQPIPDPPTVAISSQGTSINIGLTSTYNWVNAGRPHLYYCVMRSSSGPTDPQLSSPTTMTINGTLANQGNLAAGLSNLEWDYGDINGLGYDTIYVYITANIKTTTTLVANAATTPIDLGTVSTYVWKHSELTPNYQYCVLRAGKGNPALSEPPSVYINGVAATRGDCTDKADGMVPGQWDYGVTTQDNLGYDTVYIYMTGGVTPSDTIEIISNPGGINATVYYVITTTRTVGATYGQETCSAPADLSAGKWNLAGDFSAGGQTAEFNFSTGAGTITQAQGNQATPIVPNATYQIEYNIAGTPLSIVAAQMVMNPGFAASEVVLPVNPGTNIVQFQAAESPGDIVIDVTGATSGQFIIQNISIKQVVSAGMTDESGPSSVTSPLAVANGLVIVSAPAFSDPNVTLWNIYRLSTLTAAYQLVANVDASQTTYNDAAADADLGIAIPTEYTGQTGITITYAPPPIMTGLADGVYAGMLFGWNGSNLYWCEPGKPDAWPPQYTINFQHPIQNVVVGVTGAMVLCEDGPYPIQGTSSETMYAAVLVGTEAVDSNIAASTTKGAVYATVGGLILATLYETFPMTDQMFGREWWTENVSGYTAMAEVDHRLIVSYAGGTFLMDASTAPLVNWTTLSGIFTAAWKDPSTGFLYLLDSTGIKQFLGAADFLSLDWKSAYLYGDNPVEKTFDTAVLRGTGTITLNLSVEGSPVASKVMNLDSTSDRDKQLKFPEQTSGKYCQFELAGTGSVDDVIIGYLET